MSRPRSVLSAVVLPVLVILSAVAGGWAATRWIGPDITLHEAVLRDLPAKTAAINATDWAELRSQFSTAELLPEARRRDLTTVSVIASNAAEFRDLLGFRATLVDWEISATTNEGNVLLLGLPGGRSDAEVRDALRAAGYRDEGDRLVASDPALIELGLGDLRLLRIAYVRDGIMLTGDQPKAVDRAIAAREGRTARLASAPQAAVIAGLGAPTAWTLLQAAEACVAKDPAELGFDVAGQADAAIDRAGDLATYDFYAQGVADEGRSLRMSMGFASAGVAAEQAAVRERLATGPFIGRRGNVEDVIDLTGAASDGNVTTLRFTRSDVRGAKLMTGTGPMLFAACR